MLGTKHSLNYPCTTHQKSGADLAGLAQLNQASVLHSRQHARNLAGTNRGEREREGEIHRDETSEGKGGASVSESSVSRNTNFGLQRGLNRRRHPYRSVSRDTRSDFASAETVPRTTP